jgi:hypothetical protein
VAYRSWLKDVRKINDLGDHLHHFPKGKEDWDRLDEYEKKSLELQRRPTPTDPGSEKFFGCKSIFSYVIRTERIGDRFEVHFYDRSTHGFVWEYGEVKGLELDVCRARVVLVFEGISYANSVRPDPEGWLKHAEITSWRPTDDLMATYRLLCDWFYEQDGSIQWIWEFMKVDENMSWPQNDVYILIDCKRVYARDQRDEAIRKVAGDECLQLWNQFDGLIRSGKLHPSERNKFLHDRLNQ